jgi:UDPglucose 6-dehydrogenase
LPGTIRRELAPLLTKARLVYNPYLIAMGTVKEDMVKPEMVIIGTGNYDPAENFCDMVSIKQFYKPIMQNDPRYEVGTWDEAESIKIFYNSFISTKLALVNMIQDVADRSGNINVDVVTNALANSTQRIMSKAYMKAGMGDGGACHPRDCIALRSLSERLGLGYDLFGTLTEIREAQAYNMALAALKYGKNVVILGKAYKQGVPYTAGSYSLLIGHYVQQEGGNVHYYDPATLDFSNPNVPDLVYIIAYHDTWTMTVPHPGSTIFDPWRIVPTNTPNYNVVHFGSTHI